MNFIFVKYNSCHHHSKKFEMVPNPDDPMDPVPYIPPGQKPPDRSPANRECSASPRARASRPSRRRDPHGWTYNHMLGILQHASGCSTCEAYVTHFMESHLNEDTSFIDAVHRRDSEVVLFTIYRDTVLDKEHTQEDAAHYRISLDKFEAEVDDLRQHIFELEDELKSAKKTLEKAHGPSYSEVVQKSATKARAPLVPKPLIPSTTKSTSSTLLRITDSGKGKGKARQSPEPYVEDVAMGAPPTFNVGASFEWHAFLQHDR